MHSLKSRNNQESDGSSACMHNVPVICISSPSRAGDSGDVVGLKCQVLTSDESRSAGDVPGFSVPATLSYFSFIRTTSCCSTLLSASGEPGFLAGI